MREIPGVRFFEQSYARILPQLEIHLAISGVDGYDACGPVLKQTVGESPGRCADIHADSSGYINFPVVESAFEFQSATTSVLQVLPQQSNNTFGFDLDSGLCNFLIVHQDFAGKNQRLCAFTRGNERAVDKQSIESKLQEGFRPNCPTKVPAPALVQSAEAIPAERLTCVVCRFSTEFSTNVLKTLVR